MPNDSAVANRSRCSGAGEQVSKLWELRNKDRLLTNVRPAHLRKVSSGSFVICAGQMQDWRRRETNLMQLMTLLHRTCALEEEALDKVRQLLVSLCGGSAQNPIITPQRLVDILKVNRHTNPPTTPPSMTSSHSTYLHQLHPPRLSPLLCQLAHPSSIPLRLTE